MDSNLLDCIPYQLEIKYYCKVVYNSINIIINGIINSAMMLTVASSCFTTVLIILRKGCPKMFDDAQD